MNNHRDEIRRWQKSHPLFQRTHPFWQACFRGRARREDLLRWALDAYPLIRDFPRLYVQVAASCPDDATLTAVCDTVFEETGSGQPDESHPVLFRKFLARLGATQEAITTAAMSPAAQATHDFVWATIRKGDFLEGFALLGLGLERPLPAFFEMLARVFQTRHGLSEADVKYFLLHTVADVKHSQTATRLIAERVPDAATLERLRQAVFRLWDLQQSQLDTLCPH